MTAFLPLFLIFTLFFANLTSKIVECSHFHELLNYVTNETLVILDIDDTLIVPVQTLGNDVSFRYRYESLEKQGLSKNIAFDQALGEWEAIRHLTKMRIVEEGTQDVIKTLQEKNVSVMGLTTQGLALASRSVIQLNALDIDLTKTAPSVNEYYFMNGHGVLYRQGILFTSGTDKGSAFLKFCDLAGIVPKCVVFINDKLTHLKDLEKDVEGRSIGFVGLRYGYSDTYVNGFRSDVADIQWRKSTFEHIMSDEEALCLIKANN